jgi:hypothetical protein
MTAEVDEELFILSTGADDHSRYFAVEDLARLERLVEKNVIDSGALVFLTNVATCGRRLRADAPSCMTRSASTTGTSSPEP